MANKDTEEDKKEAERLAKEKAKKEAEELKRAKKEAERLAKEEAKEKAQEEKRFKEAEARAKKEAEKLAKEQAKKAKEEPAPDVSSASYEGKFQLVLPSEVGFKQVNQFTQQLAGIKDLQVVWTGGSMDEGALITVSVAQAIPLAQILSEMPMVGGVEVNGDKITVTLKTSA